MKKVVLIIILLILALAVFALLRQEEVPEPVGEEENGAVTRLRQPDALTPAAPVCAFVEGAEATFMIQEGIPSPRCLRVLGGQRIAFENNSGETLEVNFNNRTLSLGVGEKRGFEEPVREFLLPGVHRVPMDIYNGSGPEVWVMDESVVRITGTVSQTFVSARAIVVETSDNKELSLAIDSETRITDAQGNSLGVDNFSLALTPGKEIAAIADLENDTTGVALEIRINN